MDSDLEQRLSYELKNLKVERAAYERKLELCRGFENYCMQSKKPRQGKRYYYAKRRGEEKYGYIGPRDCPDVKRICEAHFLSEAIRRIDINIKLISSFKEKYLEYDQYSVNSALREVYRSNVPPVSRAYEVEGNKWLADSLAFQAKYPENYPERKTEPTSDKVRVKSVSEVVLYERFKAAGFFQVYELPLILNDYGPAMYPDFTILSPIDMETEIIVEYVGRLDQRRYREDFSSRLGRYIANGYRPGVNLFFIFSDREGHIDSMQINRVIEVIRGN